MTLKLQRAPDDGAIVEPILFGTVDQAARRYGVSARTIWRLAAQEKITLGGIGRRRLVEYASLEKLIRDAA